MGGLKSKTHVERCIATGDVITPLQKEKLERLLHVTYSCVSDTYHRPVENTKSKGLGALMAVESNDLFWTKDEKKKKTFIFGGHDGILKGRMEWRFDAGDGQKFDKLYIRTDSEIHERGEIIWQIAAGGNPGDLRQFESGKSKNIDEIVALDGKIMVNIYAEFDVGAHVFQESLSKKGPTFEFKLTLK